MTTETSAPPYGSHAAIVGVFVGSLAVAGALARLRSRHPARSRTTRFQAGFAALT